MGRGAKSFVPLLETKLEVFMPPPFKGMERFCALLIRDTFFKHYIHICGHSFREVRLEAKSEKGPRNHFRGAEC